MTAKSQLKTIGCSKSSAKRKVYSNTSLPQKTRKISDKLPDFTPKAARKRRTRTTTKNPKLVKGKKKYRLEQI